MLRATLNVRHPPLIRVRSLTGSSSFLCLQGNSAFEVFLLNSVFLNAVHVSFNDRVFLDLLVFCVLAYSLVLLGPSVLFESLQLQRLLVGSLVHCTHRRRP